MKIIACLLFLGMSLTSFGQKIELLKFEELQKRFVAEDDTLYVLNFWATWCKPCIQELPFFEQCDSSFKGKPVKIILVNLDFHSKVESVAEPFIKKRKIHSKVVHITDKDPNEWISKVETSWSGAIPATVMFRRKDKKFFKEGELTLEELRIAIERNMTIE